MDYLYYVLAILVVGLCCINIVRFATRSKNPDLAKHYQSRRQAARKSASAKLDAVNGSPAPATQSLRNRHFDNIHHRTPWGWPGADRAGGQPGNSKSVRGFADRLMKQKQLVQPGGNGSIRALLEDRYSPVNREMTEIPYQKVKRPLLRDPSEQHDQLDNLGSVETRRLRQKLQFLSAMNKVDVPTSEKSNDRKRVEFRYVELKDLKQPWGW